MKRFCWWLLIVVVGLTLLGGCAAGNQARQVSVREWPTGPGTIPPSWYNYDPAYGHWFDPWYVNPFTSR